MLGTRLGVSYEEGRVSIETLTSVTPGFWSSSEVVLDSEIPPITVHHPHTHNHFKKILTNKTVKLRNGKVKQHEGWLDQKRPKRQKCFLLFYCKNSHPSVQRDQWDQRLFLLLIFQLLVSKCVKCLQLFSEHVAAHRGRKPVVYWCLGSCV